VAKKRQIWTVKDWMTKAVVALQVTDSIQDAVAKLLRRKVHGAPVTDHHGTVKGVFSLTDLAKSLNSARSSANGHSYFWYPIATEFLPGADELDFQLPALTVAEAMSEKIHTVAETATLSELIRSMLRNKIQRLIVVGPKDRQLRGIITQTDLLKALQSILTR